MRASVSASALSREDRLERSVTQLRVGQTLRCDGADVGRRPSGPLQVQRVHQDGARRWPARFSTRSAPAIV
jgi:hypothetical protein